MIESGLNLRAEARILCDMQLMGTRRKPDNDEDKEVLREIDFDSVRDLFVLISMCYLLTLILSLFEQIFYKLTHRPIPHNIISSRPRIEKGTRRNSW